MVEVTQEDREAAAKWAKMQGRPQQAANMRRGSCDSAPLVQAFARHRIAAENAKLEEAAEVAEKWIEPVMATPHENATYRSISTAIRNLKGPSNA